MRISICSNLLTSYQEFFEDLASLVAHLARLYFKDSVNYQSIFLLIQTNFDQAMTIVDDRLSHTFFKQVGIGVRSRNVRHYFVNYGVSVYHYGIANEHIVWHLYETAGAH